jgi:hypothetical protein
MATFTNFSNVLPTPLVRWGDAGEENAITGNFGAGFAGVKLTSESPKLKSMPNSARREIQEASHQIWNISITYNPMTRDDFDPIFSFLRRKSMFMEPFFVALPQYAAQTATNKPTTAAYLRGADVVEVLDPIGTPIAPSPGSICHYENDNKIYMVTRVENDTVFAQDAPAAGVERIHLTPKLQKDYNADLIFTDPMFYVKQASDVTSYSLNHNNLYSFSLSLEEVRTV